jgi:hypothetical protein
LKQRVGYKISEITVDALRYLQGESPGRTETSIVEDAIISAAIAKGWRKPKRKAKTKEEQQDSE